MPRRDWDEERLAQAAEVDRALPPPRPVVCLKDHAGARPPRAPPFTGGSAGPRKGGDVTFRFVFENCHRIGIGRISKDVYEANVRRVLQERGVQ